nr:MurR/RpiR family transcriptional regulator [uncultured Cohaesibacter sp.]
MSQGFASYPDATLEELIAVMRSELGNLPKQEAKVVQYFLLNLSSLSFETGKSIARKAGVAEVTVGRVLRRLGCDGMKEFKQRLRQRYSVAGGVPEKKIDVSGKWRQVLDSEISAVQSVFAQRDTEAFAKAQSLLVEANQIFITGFQTVRGLAEDTARRMALARLDVRYLSPHDGMLAEWISDADSEKSCLLLIDVVPYAGECQSFAKLAKSQGRHIVMVTDEYCHWARDVADAVIYAPSSTGLFLESTLGINAALALLVDAVADASSEDTKARLKEWKQLTRGLHLF